MEAETESGDLFHYCSTETFVQILKNSTLRLSELAVSNDTQEGRVVLEVLWGALERLGMPSAGLNVLRNAELHESWTSTALGVCLSQEPDLLSQWRGYADNGRGFSVGFRREALPGLGKLVRVLYGPDEQESEIARIAHTVAVSSWSAELVHVLTLSPKKRRQYFDERLVMTKDEHGEDLHYVASLIEAQYDDLGAVLGELSAVAGFTFKGLSFKEEQEWRLVQLGRKGDDVRWDESRVIPYTDVKFPVGAISQVIIGPNNRTPIGVVKNLLGDPNIRVMKSKSTYRA